MAEPGEGRIPLGLSHQRRTDTRNISTGLLCEGEITSVALNLYSVAASVLEQVVLLEIKQKSFHCKLQFPVT